MKQISKRLQINYLKHLLKIENCLPAMLCKAWQAGKLKIPALFLSISILFQLVSPSLVLAQSSEPTDLQQMASLLSSLQSIFNALKMKVQALKGGSTVQTAQAQIADITTGLVGHWKFDEGSGTTATDSSGNGKTGTLINSPTWTTGKIGGAVNLDGVNDYVQMGNNDGASKNSYTWAALIYLNQIQGTQALIINAGGFRDGIEVNNSGVVVGRIDGSAITGNTALQAGRWYHIAFTTLTGDAARIYIDGAQDVSSGTGVFDFGSCPYFIGAQATSGCTGTISNFLNGKIDEVRIYNRALSAIDVQTLYNLGSGPADTTAPTVSVTAPASGSTVSGSSVTVSANASDNVGVVGVQFKLDGANLGSEDTTSPYSITWNTTTISNGSHTFTATARDVAGNTTTSSGVTVTVNNATPPADTQAPSTPTNLSASAQSSSQINLSWTASTDNVGVTGYRVERCQGSSCTNFSQVATPSGTSYNDTGLSANTAYRYQVRATDAAVNLSGYSSNANATTQQAGTSQLAQLAASMAPKSWAQLTGMNNFQTIQNLGYIAGFGDSAIWDPTLKQFRFLGSIHPGPTQHVIYDDATNTWSQAATPGGLANSLSHAYDHNSIDVAGRFTFFRTGQGLAGGRIINRYNLVTAQWDTLPANNLPRYTQDGIGTAYYPELGGLVTVECTENASNSGVYLFSAGAWSRLGALDTYGPMSYHCFAEYNPVHKVVIFGGGNGSNRLFRINQNQTITDLGTAPYNLGIQYGSNVTVDPVTGLYLVIFANGTFYTFHPITNTWMLISGANPPFNVGDALCTLVSTYNVIMCFKTVQATGVASVYLYKHATGTLPPPDTTTPSVPTNLSASAQSSSQINLSWTASTDNVGVTGYRVERCLGASCTNFSQIATPSTNSYNDTGLSANTTYRYQVRATDAAGNLSGYSTIASATTQSGGGGSADADFQARCNAAGVIKCLGFDLSSDFAPAVYPASGLYPAWDGTYKGTQDSVIKSSGNSSLKFTIPSNSAANVSGSWIQSFGQGFGPGQTFYVQFRQRFSPEFLTNNWGGNTSWKQAIFHMFRASCASIELTTTQYYTEGIPIMYTDCGGRGLYTNSGVPPYLLQQGDYNCSYGNINPTNCFKYLSNAWVTFYYQVTLGNWGQSNSTIKAWVAPDGQPYRQWINMANFRLDFNDGPSDKYDTITLLPYMTGKDPSVSHPTAYTWHDELIVSTQPIAAPGATPPTTLVGDLNSDRTVNALDWSIMNGAWNTSSQPADINADGIVNSIDFSLLNANWGRTI